MSAPFLLCCLLVSGGFAQLPPDRFRVVKEWRYINFTWPDHDTLRTAMTKGEYVPHNVLAAGINYHEDYYYLTLPRMKFGIPITLGRVRANSSTHPLVEPFPSWEMNRLDDCDALQNVQNVAVDASSKMWIVDGGKTNTLNRNPTAKCDPKLVIYDLRARSVEEVYVFPAEVARKEVSFLYEIVVDGDFAYISDNSRFDPGLIVFSRSQKRSWKVRDGLMGADPGAVEFAVEDFRVSTPIGIAGLALSPRVRRDGPADGDRVLFFCPISSTNLYSIDTRHLKREDRNPNTSFVDTVGNKGGQTDGMKMDNRGVLYFGLLPSSSVVRWDSSAPFASEQRTIARDQRFIQWPNSFAFDDSGNLLVLTNSLQKYVQDRIDTDRGNFRILKAYVGGKSYVYEDNTFEYAPPTIPTMDKIEDATKMMTPAVVSSTTARVPEEAGGNATADAAEDVTVTKVTSSARTMRSFVFCVLLGSALNLLR